MAAQHRAKDPTPRSAPLCARLGKYRKATSASAVLARKDPLARLAMTAHPDPMVIQAKMVYPAKMVKMPRNRKNFYRMDLSATVRVTLDPGAQLARRDPTELLANLVDPAATESPELKDHPVLQAHLAPMVAREQSGQRETTENRVLDRRDPPVSPAKTVRRDHQAHQAKPVRPEKTVPRAPRVLVANPDLPDLLEKLEPQARTEKRAKRVSPVVARTVHRLVWLQDTKFECHISH
jgi:hypothetical protein